VTTNEQLSGEARRTLQVNTSRTILFVGLSEDLEKRDFDVCPPWTRCRSEVLVGALLYPPLLNTV
jgi:hypothetical protein